MVFGKAEVYIDDELVASERGTLNQPGGMEPLGTIELSGGSHSVALRYEQGGLAPGSVVESYGVGPLILDPSGPVDRGRVEVAAEDYRELCGERWDWIEAYP